MRKRAFILLVSSLAAVLVAAGTSVALCQATPNWEDAPMPQAAPPSESPASNRQASGKTQVSLWVARNVAPGPKVRLNINTHNVPVVHASLFRIDGERWLKFYSEERPKRPAPQGAAVRQWNITVADKAHASGLRRADAYYSRQTNMPVTQPGVYLLIVAGGGKQAWGVVNITNLAVVAKRSPKRLLVWVTDAAKGATIAGARVAVYDKQGRKVASGATGADGVGLIPDASGQNNVVVSRGGDRAVVPTMGMQANGQLNAHWQTDRSIYRPGQTIQYRILLRKTLGQGYQNLPGQAVKVSLMDPKDDQLDQATLKADSMGVVAGSFEIPSEGMLGSYTLTLESGKDSACQTVEVQEYRKPEYKVDLAPTAKRRLAGEDATFKLDAQYYFGAPVPQAQVVYRVARAPMGYFAEEDGRVFDDGNLYPSDDYRGNPVVAAQTVHTDKDGKVAITFKTDAHAPDSNYVVTATVQDASRRQVVATSSVPVYSATLRLGLSTDLLCVPLGGLVPIQVRAADLDGKPHAARVLLKLINQVWQKNEGRYKPVELARLTVSVPASGKATAKLPAMATGNLIVRAVAPDGSGRNAQAQMTIYVAGPFSKTEKQRAEPSVFVRLDRRHYKPGDTLRAFVVTNQPDRPVLATLEGDDVWAYKVFPAGKAAKTWAIATSRKLCPGARVDVTQWHNLQPLSGATEFALPDATRALGVKVEPDRRDYRPGDTATYRLRTVDHAGRPVPASVSLSVVDEAIYALQPDQTEDPWAQYWGPREAHVTTWVTAPEELSGGAYQRATRDSSGFTTLLKEAAQKPASDGILQGSDLMAPVRRWFADTAYWNPSVVTGADGRGEVSFEVPGNLTTWRATARGTTADTAVGTDKAFVKANRDVMLRLATPRKMVQGDEMTLIVTVNNRSAEAHDFEVSLAATDLARQGDAVQRLSVPAKSQGQVTWTLSADRLPASGKGELLGRVFVPGAGVEWADAVQVSVPVLPRGVEERFLVGGVLSDKATATLDLPSDRLPGAGVAVVTVWAGLKAALDEAAKDVLESARYGSLGAADCLQVEAATGRSAKDKEVRETLALLARTQSSEGWGWWDDSPVDPVITAHVMTSIAHARTLGLNAYPNIVENGRANLLDLYKRNNLWEYRALLASAGVLSQEPKATALLDEVLSKGEGLSPFARLQMAEAFASLGRKADAAKLLNATLKDASEGPSTAFMPCGEGDGWSASQVETTAQALATLIIAGERPDLQAKLARWLVTPGQNWWRCNRENAAVVRALSMYLKLHPEAPALGSVEVEVAGHKVTATPSKVGAAATAIIPAEWLASGKNTFAITRSEPGEALFTVDARVFRPGLYENSRGVRVLRRFEVRNAAGVWQELDRAVKTGEPVRCTVVVWGDDLNDALRVVEPIPAGFEFIENDSAYGSRSEVRDAAVVHYLENGASPQTFRFYIRAESEGRLVALPATADYILRPATRGQSVAAPMTVKADSK